MTLPDYVLRELAFENAGLAAAEARCAAADNGDYTPINYSAPFVPTAAVTFTRRNIGGKTLVEVRPAGGGYASKLVANLAEDRRWCKAMGDALLDGFTLAEAKELAE